MITNLTHGGKREGSGPKPLRGVAKVTTSIAVTPEMQAYLRQAEPSQSEAVEVAIRRTKDFKDWKAFTAIYEKEPQ